MVFEDLFTEETKSFEYEGHTFKFDLLRVDDDINNSSVYFDKENVDGKEVLKYNQFKYELLGLTKLIDPDFTQEIINKKINIDKEWKDLTIKERFNFLYSLNSIPLGQMIRLYKDALLNKPVEESLGNC